MSIEQRLIRLERSVKIWRLTALLPLDAIFMMANKESNEFDELTTKNLIVVDEYGEEMGRMDSYEGRGRLQLSHRGCEDYSVTIASSENIGGTVILEGPDGETTGVLLSARPEQIGRGYIAVFDEAGETFWTTPIE